MRPTPVMPRARPRRLAPRARWHRLALAALACIAAGGVRAQSAAAQLEALELQLRQAQDAEASTRAAMQQQRQAMLALLDALVAQGLLARERADELAKIAGAPGLAAAPPPRTPQWGEPARQAAATQSDGVVRVPYLSQTVREQLRDQIRNDVLGVVREENWASPQLLPEWVRAVTVYGDVRVRTESDRFDDDNYPAVGYRTQTSSPAWSPDLTNTTIDRTRLTLRARLGAAAKVGTDVTAGVRLSTGTTSGPTSSSQTLGNGFNKSSVVLDRGWLRWEPRPDLRFVAGRIDNPYFGTDLLWPDDIGFDGAALQGDFTLGRGVYAFATAGVFPLAEFNVAKRDHWLQGVQIGLDWTFDSGLNWRTGLAYYDFRHVEGRRETLPPPAGALAGTVAYFDTEYPANLRLKGNTLINLNDPTSTAAPTWGLASKFRPFNLVTAVTFKPVDTLQAHASLDWVRNGAFDVDDISERAGVPLGDLLNAQTTGLQLRGALGTVRLAERGDWQVFAALRRFERDAWIDGFTDTTWNLGGTNYRGWSIGGLYAFDRHTTIGLRVTSTRNLDDDYRSPSGEATLSSAPLRIDVLQLDLNARF